MCANDYPPSPLRQWVTQERLWSCVVARQSAPSRSKEGVTRATWDFYCQFHTPIPTRSGHRAYSIRKSSRCDLFTSSRLKGLPPHWFSMYMMTRPVRGYDSPVSVLKVRTSDSQTVVLAQLSSSCNRSGTMPSRCL